MDFAKSQLFTRFTDCVQEFHNEMAKLEGTIEVLEMDLQAQKDLMTTLQNDFTCEPSMICFFKALQKSIHDNGTDKGWWKKPPFTSEDRGSTDLEIHALLHCEISEASEEVRKQRPPIYSWSTILSGGGTSSSTSFHTPEDPHFDPHAKPEGQAIELADVVIMITSYFEHKGWNLGEAIHMKHKYNKTRGPKDGWRK
jgi:hypothetical protein